MIRFLSLAAFFAVGTATFTARAQLTDQDLQVGDTVEFEGKKWCLVLTSFLIQALTVSQNQEKLPDGPSAVTHQ